MTAEKGAKIGRFASDRLAGAGPHREATGWGETFLRRGRDTREAPGILMRLGAKTPKPRICVCVFRTRFPLFSPGLEEAIV